VTNIQELLMQTATANTFRYIRINTVGIGEDLKLFLQALSEQNFGVYRHAR